MNNKQHRNDFIGLFAQHPVAANLLMGIMLIAGLMSLFNLNTQFFPNFELDRISIRVIWRGASAEDVEDSLTTRIEQELRTIDYVKKMTSTSSYGSALVMLEFEENTDMSKSLDQVKDHVSRLRNLPQDSETPQVSLLTNYGDVASIMLTTQSGDLSELRKLSYQIERELLDLGISRVNITGLPEEEIAIQIPAHQLETLGMTFKDIGDRIAAESQDLPAGELGFEESTRQIRSLDQRRDEQSFAEITLKSDFKGNLVTLEDVTDISRRAMRDQVHVYFQGQPAVELQVQRTENADALKSAKILNEWYETTLPNLPKGVELHLYDQRWELIKERMDLLIDNGLGGLVLVLLILFLFLHGRVAFWVAVGIPVSFMAALCVLYVMGGSINMISMFGLIMALGIIVDDAIVVGEDALSHYQSGEHSLEAAEGGARRMLAPVFSSSLTTIASFLPLMMIGGIMGNILFDIPFVVVCVIIASLVECFLILPGHLRHSFHTTNHAKPGRFRQRLDNGFNFFKERFFRPTVNAAVRFRWITLAMVVALLILSVGMVKSGRLLFNFFPSPESTIIYANARFIAGTPSDHVERFMQHMNEALVQTRSELDEDIVEVAVTRLGTASTAGTGTGSQKDERFGSMQLEMVSPDQRNIRNREFINKWKQHITLPPGIETFTIAERRTGPPGGDIDIVLKGGSANTLKSAAQELALELKNYAGVSAIEDDMPYGQEQLIYKIKGQGQVLGLTVENVGRQLRGAFDGQLVQIFQDGDDEVEVRVMLPDRERNTLSTLENMTIMLPNGGSAPLSSVVEFEARRGFDVLRHTGGKLAIHVTASVDDTVNNNNQIISELEAQFLPELSARYGLQYDFEGRAEEQADTIGDMVQGVILAFALIYVVLAWVFGSYGWPLIVMMAIPFGLIGAFFGHLVMDINLTILSLFGIFGLSGIVVNDSIILVTFFKKLREKGMDTHNAIIEAATQRLRAVLLTSLTTIAGLTPLLFETSLQAQFLIPMAVSISFGLMFATFLVLLVIPAALSVYESLHAWLFKKRAIQTPTTA